ncbi:hypothetical protein GRFL_2611 [Christiangramia flava JLT2011]|uniref:Uncharacterized protein n=1 Tax=Christiangramia flava JLT2011 TaxID=1229726 RepID=A0A1L7I8A6_9FLAO|nr:hypothetical protein GRFL_2611 [Christiangramia flava JLT2011]
MADWRQDLNVSFKLSLRSSKKIGSLAGICYFCSPKNKQT